MRCSSSYSLTNLTQKVFQKKTTEVKLDQPSASLPPVGLKLYQSSTSLPSIGLKILEQKSNVMEKKLAKEKKHVNTNFLPQPTQNKNFAPFHKGSNDLIHFIRTGSYKEALQLVEYGVNVNGADRHENTAITDAAQRGDSKGIKFLLEELHANPNVCCLCPDNNTALHYAASNNDHKCILILLQYGANPWLLNSRGKLPEEMTSDEQTKSILREARLKNFY